MAAESQIEVYFETGVSAAYLIKWKVKPGSKVSQGTILLLYDEKEPSEENDNTSSLKKMKATMVGTVTKLLKTEGDAIRQGCAVLIMKGCSHPIVMKDMCAECGADLREYMYGNKQEQKSQKASVAMVHSIPELVVSQEQAQILGKADENRLLSSKKLVLLVDLDQTLIHTTNDDIPANLKDVHHFQLYGSNSPWYHARLRPGTKKFLEKISKLFELHICTFGARTYAHTIAHFLDKDGRYFSHRILSRDECFNPSSKTANLSALFPCGDHLVCIIDDREDVWNYAPNLVHVKPYHFFQHTGDINAPPGLSKNEKDSDDEGKFFIGRKVKRVKGRIRNPTRIAGDEGSITEECESKPSNASKKLSENKTLENDAEIQLSNIATKSQCSELSATDSPTQTVDCESKSSVDIEVEKTLEALLIGVSDEVTDLIQVDETVREKEGNSGTLASTPTDVSENGILHVNKIGEVKSKCPAIADIKVTSVTPSVSGQEENLVDVEDGDDYLLYLSDVLATIHKTYYETYAKLVAEKSSEIPDLKKVIPQVRQKVLRGVKLVFSGIIPTNLPVEKSRAYYVAKSLGAEIQQNIVLRKKDNKHLATTHVVAARLGTIKVNEAKKSREIHVVTPDWLWCCADRWERVNEQLFPLTKETAIDQKHALPETLYSMKPNSAFKSAPRQSSPKIEAFPTYDPITGKRINITAPAKCDKGSPDPNCSSNALSQNDTKSPSSAEAETNFATSINPLMSFSSEEIASMDQEVEDLLDSPDSDEEDTVEETTRKLVLGQNRNNADGESSSSSNDALTEEQPHGWGKISRKRKTRGVADDEIEDTDRDNDGPYERSKYPRCELPRDSDKSDSERDSDDFDNSVGSVDEEMAAAVEREFLRM